MRWSDVRTSHCDQRLVIQALEAHSEAGRRILDRIAIVETCTDGAAALRRYRELHRANSDRELYFVHTGNTELQIEERSRVGVRRVESHS